MAVRAYALVRTEPGMDQEVAAAVAKATFPGVRILHSDAVVGPFDVIVEFEADNLDVLGEALGTGRRMVPGMAHTTTCLVIRLA